MTGLLFSGDSISNEDSSVDTMGTLDLSKALIPSITPTRVVARLQSHSRLQQTPGLLLHVEALVPILRAANGWRIAYKADTLNSGHKVDPIGNYGEYLVQTGGIVPDCKLEVLVVLVHRSSRPLELPAS